MDFVDFQDFIKSYTPKRFFSSVPVIVSGFGLLLILFENILFPNSTRYESIFKELPLETTRNKGIAELEFDFHRTINILSVKVGIKQGVEFNNELDYIISTMCYKEGECVFAMTSNPHHIDSSIGYLPNDIFNNQIVKCDLVRVFIKYDGVITFNEKLLIYCIADSLVYKVRMLMINSAFFVCSLCFFFFFSSLQTSQFRVIAGYILIVYGMLTTEPFTSFAFNFYIDIIKSLIY